jgi:hypothetical protein
MNKSTPDQHIPANMTDDKNLSSSLATDSSSDSSSESSSDSSSESYSDSSSEVYSNSSSQSSDENNVSSTHNQTNQCVANKPLVKYDNVLITDCSICLNTPTLPLTLSKCGHIFCYICLKEYVYSCHMMVKCPMCRADIVDDLSSLKVDNMDKAIETYVDKCCWIYESRDKTGSWMFELTVNEELEQLYQQDCNSKDNKFQLGNRNYNIDFSTMKQQDCQTSRSRKITRIENFNKDKIVQYNIRGISGVYFLDK